MQTGNREHDMRVRHWLVAAQRIMCGMCSATSALRQHDLHHR